MEKAYSYRFYPTPEQESLLRRTLGCVRLVYNKALHERTQAWYERQERVGYAETSSMLTEWKKYSATSQERYPLADKHSQLNFLHNYQNLSEKTFSKEDTAPFIENGVEIL